MEIDRGMVSANTTYVYIHGIMWVNSVDIDTLATRLLGPTAI
jgi:hypothetical protein